MIKNYDGRKIEYKIMLILLIWGSVSSIFILALVKLGARNNWVFALKDAPVYIAMLLFFARWGLGRSTILKVAFTVSFTFALALNFTLLQPDYENPLANIRQIVAPIIILLFFCSLKLSHENANSAYTALKYIILFVFSFGTIELSLELWKSADLSAYFGIKGIPVDSYGLSYMFYEPIIGYHERMTSTLLDPISLGHLFACFFIYLFYTQKGGVRKERIGLLLISALGLLLTFSKGAILQLFLAISVLNPRLHPALRAASTFIPLVIFYLIPNKTGIIIHLNGLKNAVLNLSIFGHGIGSSGNYTKMFSGNLSDYHRLGISDTYIGSLIGQIGLLGFAAWLALMLSAIYPIDKKNKTPLIILSSLILVSSVSENTLNITTFMIPAIIIALAKSNYGLINVK